tara:strand:+ start:1584 stop:1829 length:246 start_codon:yes stop_codon:yes gene_type:complete
MSLEKYVIVFDTICDGWQAVMDGEDTPALFDTKEEAEEEIMNDFEQLRRNQIESGMEPDEEPDEFAIPLSLYTKGRKVIFK